MEEKDTYKISIWRFLAYFIIYSVIGWAIETTFAFLMYGVIESRQSFMFGPFCAIYGIGASTMIITLKHFDKNNYILFFAGCIVGAIVEYIISFAGEIIVGTRWWDYSGQFLNINGRICLTYSIFWGVLALFLIRIVNPKIDLLIEKIKRSISKKALKITIVFICIFLFIDSAYSAVAQDWVLTKVSVEKQLDIPNIDKITQKYDKIYSNEDMKAFVDKYWTIENVLFAYPNLTKQLSDGKRIYIKKLYPEIRPYIIRLKPEKEGTIYDP